jgi:hypothetical protein
MSIGSRLLSEDLSFRASPKQREFLEKYAEEHGIGICAAARVCIDEMMRKEGWTS